MTTNTPSSSLPELSEVTVNILRDLREGDRQHFYAYIVSLRANHWPLRAIATPLGVSRTAVQRWQKLFDASVHVPVTEELPEVLPRRVNTSYIRMKLTSEQEEELNKLAHEASKVRRYTDPNAQSRRDAETLEALLKEYKEEGASLGQLASACGVSRSAIAQRLRKG